jgi:hypothetical protein
LPVPYHGAHKPNPAGSVSDCCPFVSPSCPFDYYYLLMSPPPNPPSFVKSLSTSSVKYYSSSSSLFQWYNT